MKIKLLASSAVLAGALMASGTASAALVLEWAWTGTLADWAGSRYNGTDYNIINPVSGAIIDSSTPTPNTGTSDCVGVLGGAPCGDGDTTFTYLGNSGTGFAMSSLVTLSEWEDDVTGVDYYRVNVENLAGLGTGNSLRYNISSTHTAFNWAELDTDHLPGGVLVTKKLFDTGFTSGTEFLTLNSIDGGPDSAFFGARTSFNVEDKIVSGNVVSISNNYTVPEPMSLSLFGFGLAAFGYSRRRAA